jgi:hypothetical protein
VSSRWYRAYADQHRNPKVVALSDRDFRLWHQLMAVACENDGFIPPLEGLKRVLSMRLDHLEGGVKRLITAGLVDALEGGYEPHNWSKRQYKSDTSTDRVQKHRRKRNVSVTPPETDTDTETEESDKSLSTPAGAGELFDFGNEEPPDDGELGGQYTAAFETWWRDYPNKTGKGKAAKMYEAAFKFLGGQSKGTARVHALLLHSLKAQKAIWKRKGVIGQYIPHAATWLNQKRFDDDAVKAEVAKARGQAPPPTPVAELTPADPVPEKRRRLTGRLSTDWKPDGGE